MQLSIVIPVYNEAEVLPREGHLDDLVHFELVVRGRVKEVSVPELIPNLTFVVRGRQVTNMIMKNIRNSKFKKQKGVNIKKSKFKGVRLI